MIALGKNVARSDEILAEKQMGETSQDDSDKPGSYDPFLDMPIALRMDTMFCVKHSV